MNWFSVVELTKKTVWWFPWWFSRQWLRSNKAKSNCLRKVVYVGLYMNRFGRPLLLLEGRRKKKKKEQASYASNDYWTDHMPTLSPGMMLVFFWSSLKKYDDRKNSEKTSHFLERTTLWKKLVEARRKRKNLEERRSRRRNLVEAENRSRVTRGQFRAVRKILLGGRVNYFILFWVDGCPGFKEISFSGFKESSFSGQPPYPSLVDVYIYMADIHGMYGKDIGFIAGQRKAGYVATR